MADTTLKIIIEAVNNAESALKGVGLNLQAAEGASKAVAFGLAAATTAAVGFGVLAVKASADAEKEMAKVNAMAKAFGEAHKNAYTTVNDLMLDFTQGAKLAGEAAIKLGFDDEDASVAFAKFATATGDLDLSTRMLAVAQDVARLKGISLEDASQKINMAMQGNVKVAKELGIEITKGQQPMETFGEIQKKVAGQAEAYSKTFAGQVDILKQNWQNFLETVGDRLLPVLTQLMTKLNTFTTNTLPIFITKIEEITDWLLKHKVVLAAVAGAIIGALVPAFIAWAAAAWAAAAGAVAAMIPLLPFIAIGAAVAAAIYGIYWAIKNWDEIEKIVKQVWDAVVAKVSEVLAWLIASAVSFTAPFIAAFQSTWDAIKMVFDIALALIIGSLELFFNLWGTDLDTVLNFITNLFSTFWNGAKSTFTIQIDFIKNVWKLWWDANKLVVDVGTKAITGLAKAMWDALVIVWNGLKSGLGAIWDALWGAMGERVMSTWEGIKQTIKNSINSIVDFINRIISAINEAKNRVKAVVSIPDIPLIPRLAQGGIVTGPTIAMIGEAGPEAVVPLSRGLAGAGMGGITINFNGTFGFSESVATDLCDMVISAVKSNLKI